MNATQRIVTFLATTVAMFFGLVSPVVAEIDPPDFIKIQKFCGKPIEWVVRYTISWVPNPRVSEPFRVGFVMSELSLPNHGFILGNETSMRQDYMNVLAHSGGGSTVDLRARKRDVQIRTIGIRASHPSGAYYMYVFDRKTNLNVSEARLSSDQSGNCRRGGV